MLRLMIATFLTIGLVAGFGPLRQAAAADTSDLTPARAGERFQHCGYEASSPTALNDSPRTLLPRFTPIDPIDGVTVFVVRDAGDSAREDGRSLAVLVFPTGDRARAAFDQGKRLAMVAESIESASPLDDLSSVTSRFNEDHGPPLFFGHGPSVWRRNLAMAQLATPPVTLVQEAAAELDRRGLGAKATPADYDAAVKTALARTKPRQKDDPRGAKYAIDRDFVGCLDAA
jgi:hypothetical protein